MSFPAAASAATCQGNPAEVRPLTLTVNGQPATGRGTEIARGWPAKAGSEDLVAAAQYFDRLCPGLPGIVMYGVSMGGNMSGLAVAAKAKRTSGRALYFEINDTSGRITLSGRAADRGCGRIARVLVAVAMKAGKSKCRFLNKRGRLGKARLCKQRAYLLASGRESRRLRLARRLPAGRYWASAVAVDQGGRRGPAGRALAFSVKR